jgi:hypothetical protein
MPEVLEDTDAELVLQLLLASAHVQIVVRDRMRDLPDASLVLRVAGSTLCMRSSLQVHQGAREQRSSLWSPLSELTSAAGDFCSRRSSSGGCRVSSSETGCADCHAVASTRLPTAEKCPPPPLPPRPRPIWAIRGSVPPTSREPRAAGADRPLTTCSTSRRVETRVPHNID